MTRIKALASIVVTALCALAAVGPTTALAGSHAYVSNQIFNAHDGVRTNSYRQRTLHVGRTYGEPDEIGLSEWAQNGGRYYSLCCGDKESISHDYLFSQAKCFNPNGTDKPE